MQRQKLRFNQHGHHVHPRHIHAHILINAPVRENITRKLTHVTPSKAHHRLRPIEKHNIHKQPLHPPLTNLTDKAFDGRKVEDIDPTVVLAPGEEIETDNHSIHVSERKPTGVGVLGVALRHSEGQDRTAIWSGEELLHHNAQQVINPTGDVLSALLAT